MPVRLKYGPSTTSAIVWMLLAATPMTTGCSVTAVTCPALATWSRMVWSSLKESRVIERPLGSTATMRRKSSPWVWLTCRNSSVSISPAVSRTAAMPTESSAAAATIVAEPRRRPRATSCRSLRIKGLLRIDEVMNSDVYADRIDTPSSTSHLRLPRWRCDR